LIGDAAARSLKEIKIAISLDGTLLNPADKTARATGLSRSHLFTLAIKDFLRRRQEQHMLDILNQVYADKPDPKEAHLAKKLTGKFLARFRIAGDLNPAGRSLLA
jgi:hypothetical protein